MPAVILDGTEIAREIVAGLQPRIAELKAGRRPLRLVVIRANDNPGSASYARATESWCAENGVGFFLENCGAAASERQILEAILRHGADAATTGIMLHMPLPEGVRQEVLVTAIDPAKDVEGMHPFNLGRLLFGESRPGPCTAMGAVELARRAVGELAGKTAVVLGRSPIVGRPAALLLTALSATVTVAHTRTRDLAGVCRSADILIAATGGLQAAWAKHRAALDAFKAGTGAKPVFGGLPAVVTADMVKPGAAVIDVGVNRVPAGFDPDGEPVRDPASGKIVFETRGDVDFEGVRGVAGVLTAPKGGTGAMTNAMLLGNLVWAAGVGRKGG